MGFYIGDYCRGDIKSLDYSSCEPMLGPQTHNPYALNPKTDSPPKIH